VYHGLALVYTRLAMMKDSQAATLDHEEAARIFTLEGHRTQARYTGFLENQAHNDYWQLAIGYWAVVLSDDTYWKAWGARRSAIYRESVTAEQIRELVMSTIPRLLRTYHDEQVHTGSRFTAHHRFYASIIEHEIEVTQAMRYVIRMAAHQKGIALPDYISQFMSPLLMKEYGYGEQAQQVVQRLEDASLSPYEMELLRSAFSPLSDIKALVSIHEYDMALGALRTYLAEQKYSSMHGALRQELARVLELATAQQLDRETWDTALQLAREGQRVQPENREFHHLAVRAVIGQATRLFREEQYMDAIGELEAVRSGLSYRHVDLDTLLSETYTEWGYEAGRDGDHDTVIHRLTKALQMLPANTRAQSGLHIAYYQRAMSKGQNGEYYAALEDAEAALYYHEEDAETLVLMATLHRLIASDLDEAKNYTQADPHWENAIDCAARQLDIDSTQESLHFLVEVGISRVLSFYASGRYTAAIELAEKLIATPYEPSAFKINLRELIAELYRDRAIGRAQDSEYHVALQDAQVAFQYYEHAGTLVLIARLHRSIAIDLDEAGHFKQADPHWRTAIDCAARQLDMVNTQESLHVLVEVGISRVLSLYQSKAYADAIDLAERLVTMPYEPSAFTVDLRALLSEMCTNYGAQIYNHGYQQQGVQLMRKALEYDPTNQVARKNLSLM
jgi:tetratricopeptide (TPR) repeat protein